MKRNKTTHPGIVTARCFPVMWKVCAGCVYEFKFEFGTKISVINRFTKQRVVQYCCANCEKYLSDVVQSIVSRN